jgi:hypothetical protein
MGISIEITFQYQDNTAFGSMTGRQYALTPEMYFDYNMLDFGETVNIDSVPLYNHAIDYLGKLAPDVEKTKICETKIVLRQGVRSQIISEKFWNGQNNFLIESIDLYPDKYTHVLIFAARIEDKYEETLRIVKTTGMDTFQIAEHSILDSATEDLLYSYNP